MELTDQSAQPIDSGNEVTTQQESILNQSGMYRKILHSIPDIKNPLEFYHIIHASLEKRYNSGWLKSLISFADKDTLNNVFQMITYHIKTSKEYADLSTLATNNLVIENKDRTVRKGIPSLIANSQLIIPTPERDIIAKNLSLAAKMNLDYLNTVQSSLSEQEIDDRLGDFYQYAKTSFYLNRLNVDDFIKYTQEYHHLFNPHFMNQFDELIESSEDRQSLLSQHYNSSIPSEDDVDIFSTESTDNSGFMNQLQDLDVLYNQEGLIISLEKAISNIDLKAGNDTFDIHQGDMVLRIDFIPMDIPVYYEKYRSRAIIKGIRAMNDFVNHIDKLKRNTGLTDSTPIIGSTNYRMALFAQRVGFKIVTSDLVDPHILTFLPEAIDAYHAHVVTTLGDLNNRITREDNILVTRAKKTKYSPEWVLKNLQSREERQIVQEEQEEGEYDIS